MVDTAMNKNEDLHYHIWGNIFLTVRSDNPCVDIWKYWKPESEVNLVPKKGICLRPTEYVHLKSHVRNLEKKFSQLETIVPCSMRDDNQTQLRMLLCPTCIPLEWKLVKNQANKMWTLNEHVKVKYSNVYSLISFNNLHEIHVWNICI